MERLLVLREGEWGCDTSRKIYSMQILAPDSVVMKVYCFQRLHCGCVASKNSYDLLDSGGVQCVTCMRNSAAQSVSVPLSHCPPSSSKSSDCTFYRLLVKWFRSSFLVKIISASSVKATSYCQDGNLSNHPPLCWIPETMILLL